MRNLISLFQKTQTPLAEEHTSAAGQEFSWSSLTGGGELLIDMYERADAVVIRSLIAGVAPEDIEISLHNDLLTIRGKREEIEEIYDNQFLTRECYWGDFSRTIVLPAPIDPDQIEANFKNGVMVVILKKMEQEKIINPMSIETDSKTPFDEDQEIP